ncbi:MAG: hypothetical protein IJX19_12595, partial [Clostridia bacterium]|nr:hypothetical protein [Clostridia bacterium]
TVASLLREVARRSRDGRSPPSQSNIVEQIGFLAARGSYSAGGSYSAVRQLSDKLRQRNYGKEAAHSTISSFKKKLVKVFVFSKRGRGSNAAWR